MKTATQKQSYNAKQINASERKKIALKVLRNEQPIIHIAQENDVSRKFIYAQKQKAEDAINGAFEPPANKPEKVLFYLPVTRSWLYQLILCLILHCRASHRGTQKLLSDVLDYEISLGSIHNIVDDAKEKSKIINAEQDLKNVGLGAFDETFHYNKPILTGIDIRSLYCFLLSPESNRDFDTWGSHLLDLQKQGLNPERGIADDASAIHAAFNYVYPNTPFDLDNFHIIKELMELRRYFRNRLKSAVTNTKTMQEKVDKKLFSKSGHDFREQLEVAKIQEKEMKYLSQSIDTLVNWMQHDVLNMPGLEPTSRYELFDFILHEFNQLAKRHSHRIKTICTTLKNQKPYLLAFTEVLNEKFQEIADKYVYPIEKMWEVCQLQRCKHSSDTYAVRSVPLQDYFGFEFDDIEDAVLEALDSTERTSSMIENLHSRLDPYFYLRREIGFGYLDLLRFYLNHVPFQRSEREERRGKTPAEILTGKPHLHWLEMLGYERFKQAA